MSLRQTDTYDCDNPDCGRSTPHPTGNRWVSMLVDKCLENNQKPTGPILHACSINCSKIVVDRGARRVGADDA